MQKYKILQYSIKNRPIEGDFLGSCRHFMKWHNREREGYILFFHTLVTQPKMKEVKEMSEQTDLRLRLCALIYDYGTPITYIAKTAKIERTQLNRFKLGKLYLEPTQCERLDTFLSERGYGDTFKAFSAIVQGSF